MVYEPKLRYQSGDPALYGRSKYDYLNPIDAIKLIKGNIVSKLNDAVQNCEKTNE